MYSKLVYCRVLSSKKAFCSLTLPVLWVQQNPWPSNHESSAPLLNSIPAPHHEHTQGMVNRCSTWKWLWHTQIKIHLLRIAIHKIRNSRLKRTRHVLLPAELKPISKHRQWLHSKCTSNGRGEVEFSCFKHQLLIFIIITWTSAWGFSLKRLSSLSPSRISSSVESRVPSKGRNKTVQTSCKVALLVCFVKMTSIILMKVMCNYKQLNVNNLPDANALLPSHSFCIFIINGQYGDLHNIVNS